jgi:ABC-2 type transport system permease protein
MSAMTRIAGESADLAWRNLLHLRRTPSSLVASLVEPVMFALLIGFIFGGSLGGPAYREYMMAGILAQTVTFSASFTTVGLARDLQEGMIDRFRTLPISRVALLLGRTTSDLTACVASVVVTTICGLLIGWTPHHGVLHTATGYLLILLFAFAMSWIGAFIGIVAPNVQVAASLGLIWLFPATFISSGFVATTTLPGVLATIAAWNPITSLSNALRQQFGNLAPPGFPPQHGWAVDHALLYSVSWAVVLIVTFAILSTLAYRKKTSR